MAGLTNRCRALNIPGMKTIAFFDFDGTLTTRDTLIDFTRFAFGRFKFFIGLTVLSPVFLKTILGLSDRNTAACSFIRYFYGNRETGVLQEKALEYNRSRLPLLINHPVYDRLARHKKNGDTIAIVSASPTIWLEEFCRNEEIGLIATRLRCRDAVLTGEVEGNRCNNDEKVIRIKREYTLEDYDRVFAYGNSQADMPMLKMADEAFWVHGSTLTVL